MISINTDNWKTEFVRLLQQPVMDRAFSLKTAFIPGKLYKYISINNLKEERLNAISNEKIWIANPQTMNDPFDSGLGLLEEQLSTYLLKENFEELSRKAGFDKFFNNAEIEDIRNSPDSMNRMIELVRIKYPDYNKKIDDTLPFLKEFQSSYFAQTLQNFNSTLRSSVKISCFSESFDSMLMWPHYADSHKGICIEYNYGSLEPGDSRRRLLYPVIYSEELFDATTFLTDQKINAPLIALLAAMYKSPHWSYEKEWRLIIPGGIIQDVSLFSAAPISAIYLGTRISGVDKELIRSVATKKNVALFQMRMQQRKFALTHDRVA